MGLKVISKSAYITEQNFKTMLNYLKQNSSKYREMMSTIKTESPDIDIQVIIDDNPGTSYVSRQSADSYILYMTTKQFNGDEIEYDINGDLIFDKSVTNSFERVYIHELQHIVDYLIEGDIPPIQDPEDPNDPGVIAREEREASAREVEDEAMHELGEDAVVRSGPPGSYGFDQATALPFSKAFDGYIINPIRILSDFMGFETQGMQLSMESVWDAMGDPLVLDLNGDGISLTSMTSSHAYFNLQDRDFATVNGWVTGGDGLLAQDLNSNGRIDGIDELFGSPTFTGFAELSTLDTNTDGKITSADADWNTLKVWIDTDEDGFTDDGELHTLSSLNITELGLTVTPVGTTINGNELVETSTFKQNGVDKTLGEVLFAINPTNSVYAGDLPNGISWDALTKPFLRGYGVMADLPVALTLNATLMTMAENLVTVATTATFEDFRTDFKDFLLNWAGVQNVDPSSRNAGTFGHDARKLEFLERYTGITFETPFDTNDPLSHAAWNRVDDLFNHAVMTLGIHFMAQVDADISSVIRYDVASDAAVLTTYDTATLLAAAPATTAEKAVYWATLAQMPFEHNAQHLATLDYILQQLRSTESGMTQDQKDFFNIGVGTWVGPITGPWQGIFDSLDRFRHETLVGGDAGDDMSNWNTIAPSANFRGGAGNDYANMSGAGVFIGNAGNDTRDGLVAEGEIISHYFDIGDGQDTVFTTANGGTDQIILADGITTGDVTYSRHGDALRVNVGTNGDYVSYANFYATSDYGVTFREGLDRVVFANGTVHDMAYIMSQAVNFSGNQYGNMLIGTQYGETIQGLEGNDTVYGNGGADTIDGGADDDTIYAGDGDDILLGGSGADYLAGENGNNSLTGGAGNDALIGGTGSDTYYFSNGDGQDGISEYAGAGTTDRIVFDSSVAKASVHYARSGYALIVTYGTGSDMITVNSFFGNPDASEIEEVRFSDNSIHTLDDIYAEALTQTGTASGETIYGYQSIYRNYTDTLYGMDGADTLYGYEGNDYLDGGADVDTMYGGAGDDTYVISVASDSVIEYANQGSDTVRTAVAYTLAAHVENLVITSGAVSGTGNTLNNTLDGSQSTGANALTGGTGDDLYIISTGDTVTEAASAGTDTVHSYITYTLPVNVERLTLLGTAAIHATGNSVGNILDGSQNSAENILSGGAGSDVYFVSSGDTVVEAANAGTDIVRSYITWTLSDNVENGQLLGTGNVNIIGNALNNILTGNAGNNVLNGSAGSDTMTGGAGDDTYYFGVSTDVVVENLNEGIDTIISGITLSLASINNVENLTLNGANANSATGNALDNVLTGNSAINTLTGGDGNDTLKGAGGADVLWGGTGADTFWFDTATLGSVDVIKDFSAAQNDVLDIKDILIGWDILDNITDFVEMTNSGGNTVMRVDRDGTGSSYAMQQVATIEGVTGLTDEQALLANGTLVVA